MLPEAKPIVFVRRTPKQHSPDAKAKLKEKLASIMPKPTMSRAQAITKKYEDKVNNRKSAIRAFCIGCSGGSYVEVKECPVTHCALYPFREGKDPFRSARAKARGDDQTEVTEEDEQDDTEEESGDE